MRLAIERDPANENYRFRYALMLVDSRAPQAAIIRLREALPQFPRSARLWFALGLAHLALHQNDEAVKGLARAVELDPRSAPAVAYLGLAHAEQGHYSEANALYERALKLSEQSPAAHYLFADLLLKQADSDAARAERHLLRAVELDPSFASARLALARVYARAEKFAAAAAQLEQAVKLEPDRADAHYQLARAYQRLGRAADARAALAAFKSLSEGQRDKERDEIRDLVRRLAGVRF
jgi:tetratricopeptide (TPR) repeat protein